MRSGIYTRRWLLTPSIVIIALAVVAWAAPVAPRSAELPDEVKAVAGLERLRMQVLALPEVVRDAGLTEQDLEKQLRGLLLDAGFELVDDDAEEETPPPAVILYVQPAEADTDLRDVIAFGVFLEVKELARIHRIEQDLTLPTATLYAIKLCQKDALKSRIPKTVDEVIKSFLVAQQLTEVAR